MSKIFRDTITVKTVSIGEKQLDIDKEVAAQERLGQFFPQVRVKTDADGGKFISIQEVDKFIETLTFAKEEAYQEGLKTGNRQGLLQGQAEGKKVLQQLNQAISDAVGQREKLLEEAKQHILELVIKVSQKVTFNAFQADPEKTLNLISGVINTLINRSQIKIKVHPQHLPIIEQHIEKFMEGDTTIKQLSIEPDPRVKMGGCFIETPTGDIDARLESQFEIIKECILNEGIEE